MRQLLASSRAAAALSAAAIFLTVTAGSAAASPTDGPSTRGEAAAVLWQVAEQLAGEVAGTPFVDVGSTHAAAKLRTLGVTSGRTDGTFGPADTLSRAHLAALSVRLYDTLRGEKTEPSLPSPFHDVAGHTLEAEILAAAEAGLVLGRGDGSFAADNPATDRHIWIVSHRLRQALGEAGLLPIPVAALVKFDTAEGSFWMRVEEADSLQRLEGAAPGEHVGVPIGRLVPGDGGVNEGRSWHLVDTSIVDATMELCDGTADDVDRIGLEAWCDSRGETFCAWSATVLEVVDPEE